MCVEEYRVLSIHRKGLCKGEETKPASSERPDFYSKGDEPPLQRTLLSSMHKKNYISFPKWGQDTKKLIAVVQITQLSEYGPQRLAPSVAIWGVGSDVAELSDFAQVLSPRGCFLFFNRTPPACGGDAQQS